MVIHTVDMFYEVHVADDVIPRADDDAAALKWMSIGDVDPSLFGLQSISQGVRQYQSEILTL
jgi:hypothetical protein